MTKEQTAKEVEYKMALKLLKILLSRGIITDEEYVAIKKEESKKIFEDLCKNSIQNKTTILVENITGGVGKNIFKAKQTKNKIIIWWFNFILFLYINKISLDDIIMFNAKWPREQSILDDIKRYNISQ